MIFYFGLHDGALLVLPKGNFKWVALLSMDSYYI